MTKAQLETIRYIIFDLDGVLIDSSEGVVAATNYALESVGFPPQPPEKIIRFIGYPLDEMFPTFCDAPIDKLKAAFQIKARHSIVESATPLDGVDDCLTRLHRAGYSMAIATTKFKVHTEGIVAKFEWNKYFTALASGDEVPSVKPAPDLLLLAVEKLGAKPQQSVMIGDTVNDILAAQAAGMKIIAVKSPFGHNSFGRYHPDFILDNVSEIPGLFNV